jgi:hypothetical protein
VKHTHILITCDHPGCQAFITGPTQPAAIAAARDAGWLTGPIDACPDHWKRQP